VAQAAVLSGVARRGYPEFYPRIAREAVEERVTVGEC